MRRITETPDRLPRTKGCSGRVICFNVPAVMNSLHFLAETKFFGLVLTPRKIIGLSGSLIFGLRFLIPWIASERARKSVIPFGFWESHAIAPFFLLAPSPILRLP